jgi:NADH:ubiquinone oxidoreductase subunit 2 (subunit N)
VALEINTLAFCNLLIKKAEKIKKLMSEAAIKYFVIQSAASAVIAIYLSRPDATFLSKVIFLSGTTAILVKLASAPFHGWFLEIAPKINIKTGIILITWQKLAPIYILMFIIKTAIFLRILARRILGRIIQIAKNKIIEILALSSVFNLSWIILAALVRTQRLFSFIAVYWTILLAVIITLNESNIQRNTRDHPKKENPWVIIILLASLGGLPPSLGFYAKLQVALESLKTKIRTLTSALLVISAINFYIYLRVATPEITPSPSKQQKNKEKKSKLIPILTVNFLPMLIITI